MPTTIAALNVLIFLLPGFISQRIIEGLVVTGKPADITRVIDALVFSLFNYLIYSLLALPLALKPVPFTLSPGGQPQFTGREVAGIGVLFLIAVFVGLIYSKSLNAGWHYNFFRKLQFTRKTGRVDVWYDVFSDFRRRWIRVHLKDGTQIIGWPDYYSDNPEKRELFLAEAMITRPDGASYDLSGPGILLTEKAEIERIEIL